MTSKLSAAATAAFVLMAAFAACTVTEGSDDSEAVVPIVPVFALGFVAGMVMGMGIGFNLADLETGDVDASLGPTVRANEAANVAAMLSYGEAFTASHMDNLALVWSFTNDHWSRQSEVAAAALWSAGSEMPASDVLLRSGTYLNASYMMTNSAAQINEFYDAMSDRVSQWGAEPGLFGGSMSLAFGLGASSLPASGSFGCVLTVAADPVEGRDAVFVSEGVMRSLGAGPATMTSADGVGIAVPEGGVDLSAVEGFEPGIYTLEAGKRFGGPILPVASADASPVRAAMVLTHDGGRSVAEWVESPSAAGGTVGRVAVDGFQHDGLTLAVGADGSAGGQPSDLASILEAYDGLLDGVGESARRSIASASAVWGVFDAAGASTPYLSSLSLPENFDNMDLTPAQAEAVTVLALRQLAEFYRSGEEDLMAQEYLMTEGSMSLFVRGRIADANGNTLFDDVVYTPFFYSNDATLSDGVNVLDQPCAVAVWASCPGGLSSWDRASSMASASIVDLPAGAVLESYELEYGGETVSEVALEVSRMHLIAPRDMEGEAGGIVLVGSAGMTEGDLATVLMWSLCAIGAALSALGYLRRGIVIMAAGIAVICVGLVGSDAIASLVFDTMDAFGCLGRWF